jgi:hypothetical protein
MAVIPSLQGMGDDPYSEISHAGFSAMNQVQSMMQRKQQMAIQQQQADIDKQRAAIEAQKWDIEQPVKQAEAQAQQAGWAQDLVNRQNIAKLDTDFSTLGDKPISNFNAAQQLPTNDDGSLDYATAYQNMNQVISDMSPYAQTQRGGALISSAQKIAQQYKEEMDKQRVDAFNYAKLNAMQQQIDARMQGNIDVANIRANQSGYNAQTRADSNQTIEQMKAETARVVAQMNNNPRMASLYQKDNMASLSQTGQSINPAQWAKQNNQLLSQVNPPQAQSSQGNVSSSPPIMFHTPWASGEQSDSIDTTNSQPSSTDQMPAPTQVPAPTPAPIQAKANTQELTGVKPERQAAAQAIIDAVKAGKFDKTLAHDILVNEFGMKP